MSNVQEIWRKNMTKEMSYDIGGVAWWRRKKVKEMISPDGDITPLLGSKLPQLWLVRFRIYKVIDIGIWVISHVYFFRGGAAMFAEEKKGALLSTGTTIFRGGALEFFVARVVSETLATPFG